MIEPVAHSVGFVSDERQLPSIYVFENLYPSVIAVLLVIISTIYPIPFYKAINVAVIVTEVLAIGVQSDATTQTI